MKYRRPWSRPFVLVVLVVYLFLGSVQAGDAGRATRRASIPGEEHADVARHSTRKVDDLDFEFVAARTEMLVP
jgi:hypothetical protein